MLDARHGNLGVLKSAVGTAKGEKVREIRLGNLHQALTGHLAQCKSSRARSTYRNATPSQLKLGAIRRASLAMPSATFGCVRIRRMAALRARGFLCSTTMPAPLASISTE